MSIQITTVDPEKTIRNLREEVKRLRKAQVDTKRLDFLNKNFFHEENLHWLTGELSKTHLKWVFYAPVGVSNDIRLVLDAAIDDVPTPKED
jgi:hypothetical protein